MSRLHAGILTAGEMASIVGIRENIAASLTWTRDHYAAVDHWLRTNGGTMFSISLSLMFTLIIAVCFL